MRLQVANKGNVRILGKVATTTSNGFSLVSWGGTWNILTSSSTKLTNKGSLSLVKSGDIVRVQGTVSTSSPTTIIAKLIQDRSFKKGKKVENKDEPEGMKHLREIFTGKNKGTSTASTSDALKIATVQSIATGNASTTGAFSVKLQNGTVMTITATPQTRFFNRSLNPIAFSDIKIGHVLAAYGSSTSSTSLNAAIIHDLSL
jgi:hypothetical protein